MAQVGYRKEAMEMAKTCRAMWMYKPLWGIIKDVRISTIGGVIQPAATIMEIVPMDDRLLVEAKIRPQDVAFIREGLPATVKITAYDFGIYGGLDGTVEHISPDTLREESRMAMASTGEESYYRVLVRTREASLTANGKTLPIMPGMTASVDIRAGEKTILDYLLKPIYKAKEAFQER
jgi:adhesin transport system membrane fusion protein